MLLAGIGAVLGVCVAGGCQSQSLRPGPLAAAPQSPAAGGLFANGPIVQLLRPTPQPPVAARDAVVTSEWRPILRASSEPLPSGEPGPILPVQAQLPVGSPDPLRTPGGVVSGSPPQEEVLTVIRPAADPPTLPPPTAVPTAPAVVHPAAPVVVHPAAPIVEAEPHHWLPALHLHAAARPIAILPVPREFDKQALPPYIIEPPDILLIRASRAITLPTQPLDGQHLVKMDGFVNLGIYGDVFLAGRTLEQAKDIVAAALLARRVKGKDPNDPMAKAVDLTLEDIKRELQVDVLAYNSKFYFIVIDGGGYGERVFRLPYTGNETVLDAMSQIGGLPEISSKRNMWIARATPADADHPKILPIDWRSVAQCGNARTNYQVYPGDRIYVKADKLIATDQWLAKILAPIERGFGATLLGASTINTIRNGTNFGGNGTGTGTVTGR